MPLLAAQPAVAADEPLNGKPVRWTMKTLLSLWILLAGSCQLPVTIAELLTLHLGPVGERTWSADFENTTSRVWPIVVQNPQKPLPPEEVLNEGKWEGATQTCGPGRAFTEMDLGENRRFEVHERGKQVGALVIEKNVKRTRVQTPWVVINSEAVLRSPTHTAIAGE